MSESTEFLMRMAEENWTQARHSEDQRATITNLIVVIASIDQGALTQTGFTKSSLPLTILLIILGIYGMIASAKLYERYRHHIYRAGRLRERLDELCPDAQVSERLKAADARHAAKHPILSGKIHLHSIWLGLHILIAALGVVYTIIIIAR